jgi:hypothetical protein
MHWSGHLWILLGLMILFADATAFHWHENWCLAALLLYLGYLIFTMARGTLRLLGRLLSRFG